MRPCYFLLTSLLMPLAGVCFADDQPGHSVHGEAFNEGPRQEAILIHNTGEIEFPITTSKPIAQRFFAQGVGQLHGFWYFEAERTFRQVAKLDPECAMAYWGMAMANVNNEKRAKGFLAKASECKEKITDREKLYIATLENFYREDKRDKKQRAQGFITDLEKIVQQHPNDVEAKAFLGWKIWHAKGELPISSPMAVDAILDQVFAVNPMHPAHHYRIHLWDGSQPARALASAARCGQAAPAIAHMWHMPGHIYSKVRRFDDAAWHQEASTRVDHAAMITQHTLPDQIHNYAHNEEWLIRTFNELGRASDAIALAKSLIANPRHPALNTLDMSGKSAAYGRTRLIDTLVKWQLWDELIVLHDEGWIGPVSQPSHNVARLKALGFAHYGLNNAQDLDRIIQELTQLDRQETARLKKDKASAKQKDGKTDAKTEAKDESKDDAKTDSPSDPSPEPAKELIKTEEESPTTRPSRAKPQPDKKPKSRPSETALAELRALHAALTMADDATSKLEAASGLDRHLAALAWLQMGNPKRAAEVAEKLPQDLAGWIAKTAILQSCEKPEAAKTALEQAIKAAYAMDENLPAAITLRRLATEVGGEGTRWRDPAPTRTDLLDRPKLETLGPVHWSPPPAPSWTALDLEGAPVVNGIAPGKPQILIFYLGAECTHCVEQIRAFAKVADGFASAGIHLQCLSPQPPVLASRLLLQSETPGSLPFPILCDPDRAAFKAFRVFDDFENEPLHGVVLIDGSGRLRWIDVSYQPFMDHTFLLEECKRLLALPEVDTFTFQVTSPKQAR